MTGIWWTEDKVVRTGMIFLVMLAFIAMVFYMLVTDHKDAGIATGTLLSIATMAAKRLFDSSPSSERKTELLARNQPIEESSQQP